MGGDLSRGLFHIKQLSHAFMGIDPLVGLKGSSPRGPRDSRDIITTSRGGSSNGDKGDQLGT